MPSNCTGQKFRRLAERFTGKLAHLMGPEDGGWRTPTLPYALDNGAFGAWRSGERWQQKDFLGLCEKAVEHHMNFGTAPLSLLCPDVVADRAATLRSWDAWQPSLARWYGWPLAFAVQDGMTAPDVPSEATMVFVGGTTAWKRRTLETWCRNFPRVHVGRINTRKWLWVCAEFGVESCDGTGWFYDDQTAQLEQFLTEWQAGHRRHPNRHPELWEKSA